MKPSPSYPSPQSQVAQSTVDKLLDSINLPVEPKPLSPPPSPLHPLHLRLAAGEEQSSSSSKTPRTVRQPIEEELTPKENQVKRKKKRKTRRRTTTTIINFIPFQYTTTPLYEVEVETTPEPVNTVKEVASGGQWKDDEQNLMHTSKLHSSRCTKHYSYFL